eukprot:281214-Pyramimonas_sp.AAC.1
MVEGEVRLGRGLLERAQHTWARRTRVPSMAVARAHIETAALYTTFLKDTLQRCIYCSGVHTVAVYCGVLRCTAVYCGVLRCTA